VKSSGRDETMWVAIYTYIGAMLEISLYSYLYSKLAKMLYLFYYLLCFLFNKVREQEGETSAGQKHGWGGLPKQNIHLRVDVKMIK
jgi:hypothetical protein